MLKKIVGYVVIFFAGIGIDQWSKLWALSALDYGLQQRVNEFMQFSLSMNRGVSWSMWGDASERSMYILTTVIVAVISCFLIYTVVRLINKKNIFFETLVLSGAVSNIIDRLLYGAVVDFIDFHAYGWHWPTFNVADSLIVAGVIGIVVKVWVYE